MTRDGRRQRMSNGGPNRGGDLVTRNLSAE